MVRFLFFRKKTLHRFGDAFGDEGHQRQPVAARKRGDAPVVGEEKFVERGQVGASEGLFAQFQPCGPERPAWPGGVRRLRGRGLSGRCGRRWPAAARRRPSGEFPRCRSARRLPPRVVRPACVPVALRPRARKSEPRRASDRIRRSRLRAEGSGRRSRRRATPLPGADVPCRRGPVRCARSPTRPPDSVPRRRASRYASRAALRRGRRGVRTVRATRRRARRCVRRRCARGPGPDARSGIGRDRSKQKDFQQQFAQQFAVRRAARTQSLALGVVFAQ